MSDETNKQPRSKEEILGILKGEIQPEQKTAAAPAQPASEPPVPPPTAEMADVKWTDDQVREVLRGVYDPEIHINIVDLGLVYGVVINCSEVLVRMSLTSPGCPYGPYLIHQVKDTVQSLKGISKADVEVVWDPPWGPAMMTEEVRLELGFDV